MQMSRLTVVAGIVLVLTACSRSPSGSPKLFEQLPFPQLSALTCELTAVHDGALNPGYERGQPGFAMNLTITNLDEKVGSAQVIANNGTAEVLYRRIGGQMHFLEQTPSGNITLLSVYAPPEADNPLPAAYSRHVLITPANVAISQYAGLCRPKL